MGGLEVMLMIMLWWVINITTGRATGINVTITKRYTCAHKLLDYSVELRHRMQTAIDKGVLICIYCSAIVLGGHHSKQYFEDTCKYISKLEAEVHPES